jgi:chorismate synthase
MEKAILSAKESGDSVGGVVECVVTGVSRGLGAPFFDSAESRAVAIAVLGPAVKGVEFGMGFAMARLTGSMCNDEMASKTAHAPFDRPFAAACWAA